MTMASDQFARRIGMATTMKAELRVKAATKADRLMRCWPSRSRLGFPLHSRIYFYTQIQSAAGRLLTNESTPPVTHHQGSGTCFRDPEHVSSGLAGGAGPSAALPTPRPGDLEDNVGARVENADQLAQCAAHSSSHSFK